LNGHFFQGALIGNFYTGPGGNSLYEVDADMNLYQPDIVFLHIGTNDLISKDDISPYRNAGATEFNTATLGGRIAYLIAHLLKWKSGINGTCLKRIFVSRIIPRTDIDPYRALAFNYELDAIVSDCSRGKIAQIPAGSLSYVRQYDSFNASTMLFSDKIHPNDAGYVQMGQVYFSHYRYHPLYFFVVSGDSQQVIPGTIFPAPLKVRITDGYGKGLSGYSLRFTVASGDATLLDGQPVTTDSQGYAQARVQAKGEAVSEVTVSYGLTLNDTLVFHLKSSPYVTVTGQVAYYRGGGPVKGVRVNHSGSAAGSGISAADGRYSIASIPYGDSPLITPDTEFGGLASARATVLSYDAALTARFVMGVADLSAAQQTAADVNRDGRLTIMDAVNIARFAVGYAPGAGTSLGQWRFTPESRQYGRLNSDLPGQDFTALLMGDVHGGYNASAVPKTSESPEWDVRILEIKRRGDEVSVPLEVSGPPMLSMDISCSHDPSLEFAGAEKEGSIRGFQMQARSEKPGELRIGVYNSMPGAGQQAALILKFRGKGPAANGSFGMQSIYINDRNLGTLRADLHEEGAGPAPGTVVLKGNYPNPFNGYTTISYSLPAESRVRLRILNVLGQTVACLADGVQAAGNHSASWDGSNARGLASPSGVYFYVLEAEGQCRVGRMEMMN
jgi:lysophospholipase L1-like esterase